MKARLKCGGLSPIRKMRIFARPARCTKPPSRELATEPWTDVAIDLIGPLR